MYDSVTLFAPVHDPARLVSSLEDVQERYIQRTGEMILTGRSRNLYIKTSGSGVTVNGSLSRYWLGSNVLAPTFSDCREALRQLEEELGSSMATMSVYRLDIAATLNMKHPCPRYLRMFGSLPRFKRFERDKGLLYKTKRRELDFYDKRAEARSRKEALPKCFNGRNALRYELRYRQFLKEQFGGKVTAERLVDVDFFRDVVQRWVSSYHAVDKHPGTLAVSLDMTSPKSFGTSLERFAIDQLGGEAAILEDLSICRDAGEVSRVNYSRIRAKIARLCRNSALEHREEPIRELDTAVLREAERLQECA